MGDLLKDMIVPPLTTVQGKSQVTCLESIRNGASIYRDGVWWDDMGACEEDNMGHHGVEGEATGSALLDLKVHSALDLIHKDRRVTPAAENGTVVCKGNSDSVTALDQLDHLVKSQQPEGRRANPALGNPIPVVRLVEV